MTPSEVTLDGAGVADRDGPEPPWWSALAATGQRREEALTRLHAMLLRVAHTEMRRRSAGLRLAGAELDDLAYQAAADALVSIIAKLGQFRGDSRFITWAYKFVIFEVSTKIARHFSRRPVASLDSDDWDGLPDRFGVDPAEHAQRRDLVTAVRRAVYEQLTDRQRRVFMALVVHGVPLDVLVIELASNRNALYKVMFDARRTLRTALAADGYLDPAGVGGDRLTGANAVRPS